MSILKNNTMRSKGLATNVSYLHQAKVGEYECNKTKCTGKIGFVPDCRKIAGMKKLKMY